MYTLLERVEAALTRRLRTNDEQKGTLLLDTLIAMAILAIVFAVAYPNYAYARQQSQVAASTQQLNAISSAIAMYANDNSGANPVGAAGTVVNAALFGGTGNPYFNAAPLAPASQLAYTYGTTTGPPTSYILTDPTTYVATLLSSYNKKGGAACGGTGCTHINYDPNYGLYGS